MSQEQGMDGAITEIRTLPRWSPRGGFLKLGCALHWAMPGEEEGGHN